MLFSTLIIISLLGLILQNLPAVFALFAVVFLLFQPIENVSQYLFYLFVNLAIVAIPITTSIATLYTWQIFPNNIGRRTVLLLSSVLGFYLLLNSDYIYLVLQIISQPSEQSIAIFTKLISSILFASAMLASVILILIALVECPLAWCTQKLTSITPLVKALRPLMLVMIFALLFDLLAQFILANLVPANYI